LAAGLRPRIARLPAFFPGTRALSAKMPALFRCWIWLFAFPKRPIQIHSGADHVFARANEISARGNTLPAREEI